MIRFPESLYCAHCRFNTIRSRPYPGTSSTRLQTWQCRVDWPRGSSAMVMSSASSYSFTVIILMESGCRCSNSFTDVSYISVVRIWTVCTRNIFPNFTYFLILNGFPILFTYHSMPLLPIWTTLNMLPQSTAVYFSAVLTRSALGYSRQPQATYAPANRDMSRYHHTTRHASKATRVSAYNIIIALFPHSTAYCSILE